MEDVYVNGQIAGGAGRLGGGGGMSCCVLLPETWRAGLVAKVTWVVLDWEHENIEETKRGVHRSIKELGHFQAVVPIEYYKRPENLYLHFYDNGKVRAVSSLFDAFDSRHPVSFSAEENGSATAGKILKRE